MNLNACGIRVLIGMLLFGVTGIHSSNAATLNPTSISGLRLWLAADDLVAGAEPTDGTDVSTWQDLSGNGKDAVDAKGASFRPTVETVSGNRVVRFDSSTGVNLGDRLDAVDLLGGSSFGDVTIFAVYQTLDESSQIRPLGLGAIDATGNSSASVHLNLSTDTSLRFDGSAIDYAGTHPDDLFIRTTTHSGTLFSEMYDSTTVLTPTAGASVPVDDFYLGEVLNPTDSDIAEVLIFDRILTDGSLDEMDNELNDVQFYLQQKYGLNAGFSATPGPVPIPEPSSIVLLSLGALLLRRRRSRASK